MSNQSKVKIGDFTKELNELYDKYGFKNCVLFAGEFNETETNFRLVTKIGDKNAALDLAELLIKDCREAMKNNTGIQEKGNPT